MKINRAVISTAGLLMSIILVSVGLIKNQSVLAAALQQTGGRTLYLPFISTPAYIDFLETFNGSPTQPQPWQPTDWDVTVHSRDIDTWDTLEVMQAAHGTDCSPSPAMHTVSEYQDAVFLCRDHLMTSINATGYGVIYLTPNKLVSLDQGEAVIQFDLSTLRNSGRDWVDVWITPYDDNLQLPLADYLPDLSGEPRRSLQVEMSTFNDKTIFHLGRIANFIAQGFSGTTWIGYEDFLIPSATRRDKFELRITRNHIKFGMPAYNFWWYDTDIPALDWSLGVVQFGHHSYNPKKDCSGCAPSTWHWDNIRINPALPFAIVRATQRYTDVQNGAQMTLAAPAPSDAHLRFSGIGKNLQVSYDNGATWINAAPQAQEKYSKDSFWSYWMPIPKGIQTIKFKGTNWWGGAWRVQNLSVWSLETK